VHELRNVSDILLTTRNKKTAHELTGGKSPLLLEAMNVHEARQLLHNNIRSESSVEVTDALLAALNHLPLAMKQAAAINEQNTVNLLNFLKLFQKEADELLSEELHDLTRYADVSNAILCT